MRVDVGDVIRGLRGGVATLDALAARTGADRDGLLWALEDARARGWVTGGDDEDCGPDGVCGSTAPALYSLTEAGRQALATSRRP